MEGYKYKAFISYSHDDEKWATWLLKGLESYRPPKRLLEGSGLSTRPLTPIFRDRDELASSRDLSSTILQALQESENLIVVCSPSSAQSRWVNEEIRQFGLLRDPGRVFCLLVDDPETSFPPTLLAGNAEPLAADARSEADGRRGARLKIVASLLKVPYATLQQREARRRSRRLVAVAAASLAGMLLTTTLAMFALLAQGEAEEQRQLANAEAQTAQNVSEFLVDLFKVTDPNESNGETVTARALLDRGLERIATLADEPSVQVRLISTMGEVYLNLGLFDEARQLAAQGLQIAQQQSDEQIVTRAEIDLALVEHFAGDPDAARAPAETALERALRADDLSMKALAHQTLGRILMVSDEYEPAHLHLNTAVQLFADMYGADDPRLAEPLNLLAGLNYYIGELNASRESYERILEIQERAYGPEHFRLAATLNNLALVYDQALDWPASVPIHERALEIRERVLEPDHPDIAETLNNLGNARNGMGDLEGARAAFERALAIRRAKNAGHPKVATVLSNLGLILADAGQTQRARELFEESVAIYEETMGPDHTRIAFPLAGLGRLELKAGRLDRAREYMERAIRVREAALGDDHLLLIAPMEVLFEIAVAQGDEHRAARLQSRLTALSENRSSELRNVLAAPPDASVTQQRLQGVSADAVLGQVKAYYAEHGDFAGQFVIEDVLQYWVDAAPDGETQIHVEYVFRKVQYGQTGCDARTFGLRREADGWRVTGMGPNLSARFHTWLCTSSLSDSLEG